MQAKKRKTESVLIALPSEILEHHVFSFLSSSFLINVCGLVSKEWFRSLANTPLTLTTSKILDYKFWDYLIDALRRFDHVRELHIGANSNFLKHKTYLDAFKNSKYLTSLSYIGNFDIDHTTLCNIGEISTLKILKLIGSEELFVSPLQELQNLEQLELSGYVYSIGDLNLLPKFTKLTITGGEIYLLSDLKNVRNLRELICRAQQSIFYTDKDLKHFANLTDNLTKLELCKHNVGSIGAGYISQLKSLVHLEISFGEILDDGARELCKLTNLQTLILTYDSIGFGALDLFDHLQSLTYLDLTRNYLFDADISNISKLANLTHLILDINRISSLEEISKLERLKCLKMDRNHIQNVEPLIGMRYLNTITLSENYIMPKTKVGLGLGLVSSNIGDEGVKHLITIPSLTELHLDNANVTKEGKALLVNQKNIKILTIWDQTDGFD